MLVNGQRALAHTEKIAWVKPIEGADNIELVGVLGWTCIAKIDEFKEGDVCVYIEIDSKVPEKEWSEFLRPKHFKVKTMKLGKFKVISQGLALPLNAFDVDVPNEVGIDVTDLLEIVYSVKEDNFRKAKKVDKYQRMSQRLGKKAARPLYKWLYKRDWGKVLLWAVYGNKQDNPKRFPKQFEYIKPTDQERCENMPWVLEDKTPFIVTQKCDGSSATYILARTHRMFGAKYEYYVCSRNVRQFDMGQECFHDENYYWMAEFKYHIRDFLEDYLNKHSELEYVCVQGELCHPKIQKNPHGLKDLHFFAFHMIDSKKGMYDIRDAKKIWDEYNIESVPIICDDFIMPDDFEEFKLMADGKYDPSVCEGQRNKAREGFVYYKTTDPNFSFKNVSRKYLLKH